MKGKVVVGTLVLPPKHSFRHRVALLFLRPWWIARWWLGGHWYAFRKSLGPVCDDCGERYIRVCHNCELREYVKQIKLEQMRPQKGPPP